MQYTQYNKLKLAILIKSLYTNQLKQGYLRLNGSKKLKFLKNV